MTTTKQELSDRREKKLIEFFTFLAMKFDDRELLRRAPELAANETLGIITAKVWCQWLAKQAGNHGSREMELCWRMLDSLENPPENVAQPKARILPFHSTHPPDAIGHPSEVDSTGRREEILGDPVSGAAVSV